MKPSINSVLLFAGTVLGVLLIAFFILDDDGGRGPTETAAVQAVESSATAEKGAQAELGVGKEPIMKVEAQRAEMAKPKSRRQLAREAKKEEQAKPEGPKLFGTIMDPNGFGISGAEVKVSATGETKNLFGMIVDNFSKKTTSGVGGNFEVPRGWIVDDEVSVEIKARGYQVLDESREPSVPEGRADLGIIELVPAVVLAGVVLDAAGEPISGVKLLRTERGGDSSSLFFMGMGGSQLHSTVTDKEGRFELAHEEVGEYDLIAKHKGYPQQTFEGTAGEAGDEYLDIVIRMDATASLSGQIAGFPRGMERIVVQATPVTRGEDDNPSGLAVFIPMADAKAPSAKVAADGSFQIDGLVPSKLYSLKALQQKGFLAQVACSDVIEVLSGSLDLSLTWEKAARITLLVKDLEDDEPLAEGSLRFLWLGEKGPMGDMARQRKFKGGKVTLEELRPEPDPGKLQILLYAPGYKEYKIDSVAVVKGEQITLPEVLMARAALLRVRVLDASTGEPLRRAYVELAPQQEGQDEALIEGRKSDGNTDAEGWISLESCMTAMARLTVRKGGFGEYVEQEVPMPTSGTKELVVELTPAGSVEAFVVDRAGRPVKNSRVYAIFGDGEEKFEDTNSRGRARFKRVPPGEHRFRGERHLQDTKTMSFRTRRQDNYNDDHHWTSVVVSSNSTSKASLVVPMASILGGRITAGGKALQGASVHLMERRESKAQMDSEFAIQSSMGGGFSGVSRRSETDAKGVFSMTEVPIGSHVIYVVSRSGSLPHTFPVNVIEGDNYVDLDIPISSVSGVITGQDGRPISGAGVFADATDSAEAGIDRDELQMMQSIFGRGDGGPVPTTNADGEFTIPNVPPDVALQISVVLKGYISAVSEELTVSAGEAFEGVRVMLSRAGSIRVRVGTREGSSRFVMARATYAGDEKDKPVDTTASGWGTGGSVLIEGLAPGLWRVSLDDLEGAGSLVEVFSGSRVEVTL